MRSFYTWPPLHCPLRWWLKSKIRGQAERNDSKIMNVSFPLKHSFDWEEKKKGSSKLKSVWEKNNLNLNHACLHFLIMTILRTINSGYVLRVCIPRSPIALDVREVGPREDFLENHQQATSSHSSGLGPQKENILCFDCSVTWNSELGYFKLKNALGHTHFEDQHLGYSVVSSAI